MKIVMIGQFPPHIGGVSVHIHTLAKELIKQGHEVYVITYPHKDIKDIDGIHVIGTSGLNIPGLRGLSFYFNAKKQLKKLILKENINIIHGHYLVPAGLVTVNVGKQTNTKTYVTAHGSDIYELYNKKPYIKRTIKKVLKRADVIFAVSESLKNEISKINIEGIEDKLRLYWNSVDISKFKPNNNYTFKKELIKNYNLDSNKPIVLFIGNIIKRKNVETLIEAKKECENEINLIIVGDGPLLKNLKYKVKKENIKNIYFTGSRDDVENIIPSCDMLILPSYTESFGLVLIEALACSKPVIGSNVGGIKEIINKDVGLLINPNNPKTIAKAIDKIIINTDLRNTFISNARSRAEKFSKVEIPYDELK